MSRAMYGRVISANNNHFASENKLTDSKCCHVMLFHVTTFHVSELISG